MDIDKLKRIAKNIRRTTLKMAYESKSPHIGSALSYVDILVALYFSIMEEDDHFILSKGHGCMSYYAALAEKGIISKELLKTYATNGSKLAEHPLSSDIFDVATGSLGHGLSVGLGLAAARKIKNQKGFEFVLLGDGECNEGSVWEAAMVASNRSLNNLIAIVDSNQLQATQFSDLAHLPDKWASFNWNVQTVYDVEIKSLIFWIKKALRKSEQPFHGPTVIIANTTKGKGVSFMEDKLEWHYRHPNKEEYEKAIEEINNA